MATEPSSAAADSTGQTWEEIEVLVEEIARFSKTPISARQFYTELLDRAVHALAAEGGAVWLRGAEGGLRMQYQIAAASAGVGRQEQFDRTHLQLLASIANGREARLVPPHSGLVAGDAAANPSDLLIVAAPLRADDEILGVLEVFQSPGGSPAAHRGYLQLVEVLAELASDFHRYLELRELRDRAALWAQLDQFGQRVHESLDLDRTAYTIANEGRRLLDCDRLSVAVMRGRGLRIRAVSGVDHLERRSNSIRLLEQLVRTVMNIGEPLWFNGDQQELPPQVENALQLYLDESHARTLAILPLTAGDDAARDAAGDAGHDALGEQPVGALIVEQFSAHREDDTPRKLAGVVGRHSASALRSSLSYHALPLMPVMRAVGRVGWFARWPQAPIAIGAGLVLLLAVVAMILVPAELQIGARGEMQPSLRRQVFAPSDGVVDRLFIASPAESDAVVLVDSGQVLVELDNSELRYEKTRVEGQRQTVAKQLATVQWTRRAASASASASEREASSQELGVREEELKEQLSGLDKQLEVLREREQELKVTSPITGEVLTWDASQLLDARPVRRGQALLTVADVDGDWLVDLYVPDHHAGHVTQAWKEHGTKLPVEFKLKSDPGVTHRGAVQEVSPATQLDDQRQVSLRLKVKLDAEELAELKRNNDLRPGTTVVANVQCGTRSIGYVWLHDLIDAARTWVLF
ncbi:MAG: HlyD family secretion protein [Pirellulaceae bacterium]